MVRRNAHAVRWVRSLAACAVAVLVASLIPDVAEAETRYLKLYNVHTHEKATFPYKVNGRYDDKVLGKVNWFLRDWRKSKSVEMDPRLLDLIWEAYRQSGSREYINVICGYRSPTTNSMLRGRSRSSGVAEKSQHVLGRALDFFIPDVPLAKMRAIGLKMQVGGVGYYPKSGSPFVHFDIGNARHWPRMNRRQLLALFPNGRTVHVPSDGRPLPGYQQALAEYKQRRGASEVQVANASSKSGNGKTLLSFLFGGRDDGADEADDLESATPVAKPAVAATPPAVVVASVRPSSRPVVETVVASVKSEEATIDPRSADDQIASNTNVTALDLARVPLPRMAPVRLNENVPFAVAGGKTKASELAKPEPAARSTAIDELVAALDEQNRSGDALEAATSSTLAYAVPMPSERPLFASILEAKAPMTPPESGRDVASQQTTSKQALAVTISLPKPAPLQDRKSEIASASAASVQTLVERAVPQVSRPARQKSQSLHSANRHASISAESSTGKTGRIVSSTIGDSGRRKVAREPSHGSQPPTRYISMIGDPASALGAVSSARPNHGRLVAQVPKSLLAEGFAASELAGSDSFTGSAVRFLPLVKLD